MNLRHRWAGLCCLVWFAFIVPLAAQEQEPLLRLDAGGPTSYVTGLAFRTDGEQLFGGGWDKLVRTWNRQADGSWQLDPSAQYRVPIGPGLDGAVNAIALSPDGRWLAAGGKGVIRGTAGFRQRGVIVPTVGGLTDSMRLDEGTVYVFDTVTKNVRTLRGHLGSVLSLAFVPGAANNPHLVSAAREWNSKQEKFMGVVRMWDLSKPAPYVAGLVLPEPESRPTLATLPITGRGNTPVAIAWGDGKLRLWDGRSPTAIMVDDGKFNDTLVVLPGNQQLLTGSFDGRAGGQLKLWDLGPGLKLTPGRVVALPSAGDVHFIPRSLAWVPAAAGQIPQLAMVQLNHRLTGASQFKLRLLPFVNGALDLKTAVEAPLWSMQQQVVQPALAVAHDGSLLAVAGDPDHSVKLFSPVAMAENAGAQNAAPQLLRSVGSVVRQLVFLKNGETQALGLSSKPVTAPDTDLQLAAGDLVYDWKDGQIVDFDPQAGWQTAAPNRTGWNVRVVPAAGATGQTSLVVTHAGKSATVLLPPRQVLSTYALRPTAERPAIIVASHENGQPRLALYAAETGAEIRNWSGHSLPIRDLAVSADGRLVASSSEDQTISVWSLTDLDLIWGRHGMLPGVTVTPVPQGVSVVSVAAESPLKNTLLPGDILRGAVRGGKLVPWPTAFACYDSFWRAVPGSQLTVRRTRGAATQDVNIRVAQGIDEAKPLCSLFVLRDANGAVHRWLGWSPVGPYDLSDPAVETYLGWHFNTNDPKIPTAFAQADQYRGQYYRKGVMAELIRDGELKGPPKPEALERPDMALTLPELAADPERFQGAILTRQPLKFAELLTYDFPAKSIREIRLTVDGQAAGTFEVQADQSWRADLSKLAWTPGEHSVQAELITRELEPQAFPVSLLVRYQPPAPQLQLVPPGRPLVKQAAYKLQGKLLPGLAGDNVLAVLQHTANGKEVDTFRWPVSAGGPLERTVELQPGENVLQVQAAPEGATEDRWALEKVSAEIRVTFDPAEVPAPQIRWQVVADPDPQAPPVAGAPILPSVQSTVFSPVRRVRVRGQVTATQPLTAATVTWAAGQPESLGDVKTQPVNSLEFDLPVEFNGPSLQGLLTATTAESKPVTVPVIIEFLPPLPTVLITEPFTGLDYLAGRDDALAVLKGQLDWTGETFAVTVQVVQNGRTLPVQVPLDAMTQQFAVPVPLVPGENRLSVVVQDPKQRIARSGTTTVYYRRPPEITKFDPPTVGTKPLVEVAAQIKSALPLARVEINGQPVPQTAWKAAAEGEVWALAVPNVPLVQGDNTLRLVAWNADGRCLVPGEVKVKFEPPPPARAAVEFLDPFHDLAVTSQAYPVRFLVTSATPLASVRLLRNREVVFAATDFGQLKPDADGQFVFEQEATLELHSGTNHLELVAINDGGESRAEVNLSQLQQPVQVLVERIESRRQPGTEQIAVTREADGYRFAKPIPTGDVMLVGRVVWPAGSDEGLDDAKQRVQVWVNGFHQAPVTLDARLPGQRERTFKVGMVLNQLKGNQVEIALPGLARAANSKLELLVDCEVPQSEQRLHLLIVGVGVPATATRKLEDQVLKALSADRVTSDTFKTKAFAAGKLYGPLVGDTITKEQIVTQLMRISRTIEGLYRAKPAGDVVMIYFLGGELVQAEDRFFLTTRPTVAGEQEKKVEELNYVAVDSQLLTRFLSNSRGAHVLLLDVRRADEQLSQVQADWPERTRAAMLQYTWRQNSDVTKDGPLVVALEESLRTSSRLAQVDEELAKRVPELAERLSQTPRYERHLPADLRELQIATPATGN